MTALIILAAGSSSRLGQPKQNLVFKDKTLLQRAIETGLASKCGPVIVVLGANAELIQPSIQYPGVRVMINQDWAEGMASSVKFAIMEVEKKKQIDSAIIMLCDQPFVSAELLDNLGKTHLDAGTPIVASSYLNTIGVPALFHRSLFSELGKLTGHEGAKKIIKAHQDQITSIPFNMGGVDIDTITDYHRLINSGK
ncbi:nucleotidyltransferase family protein [Mucilaginibacter agri]|uniref:NTP transferase domain-containing protein n=1 Tax=Mucilaginibacter agri TaxID=2695265 RepID=A0A965ZJV0_9SPHI|nr:nucleotidyltransferase family protein [Mucilaginibacter agri]NCD70971.1 NTP transferase domain-containing protein [Mucilaginibacter agri]